MATTISPRLVLNDDSGTPAAPVGDGDAINNDVFQELQDIIDGLMGAAIVYGGTISSEALGTHSLTAGGVGGQVLQVRNTSAGTGNYAAVNIGNDTSAALLTLNAYASNHAAVPNVGLIDALGSGGLYLRSTNASGHISLHTGAAPTERMRINADGLLGYNTAPLAANLFSIGGSYAGTVALRNNASVFATAAADAYGFYNSPTLVEANSGAHPNMVGALLGLTLDTTTGGGGASTTIATTLFVTAPTGAATNYTIYGAGLCRFGSASVDSTFSVGSVLTVAAGSVSAPAVSWSGDPNTGMYSPAADSLAIACAGLARVTIPEPASGKGMVLEYTTGEGGNLPPTLLIERNDGSTGAPGTIALQDKAGVTYYLWFSSAGVLRFGTSPPSITAGDAIGAPV